jgi:hypothetical protein
MDGGEFYRVGPPDDGIDDPGPAHLRREFDAQLPSPPNGFPAETPAEALQAVVLEHQPDGLGHCRRCGDEWTCRPRLRATAELRARGAVRPVLDAP